MRTPVSLGVVGAPTAVASLAQALDCLPESEVRWLCSEHHPLQPTTPRRGVRQSARFADLLNDEKLDAVAIAAPVVARYELACAALEADKHVFVQGVPAQGPKQIEVLTTLARRRARVLMTGGSVDCFDPGLERLRAMLAAGELGDTFYLECDRRVLGRAPDQDELLWSAGAEEVAMVLHVLGDEPVSVEARGESYLDAAAPDVLHVRLVFATGILAELRLSALDARPVAQVALVGSTGTAVLDRSGRVLTVHAKVGGDRRSQGTTFSVGDIVSPRIGSDEPLRRSHEAFFSAIRSATTPVLPSREAVAVVETLEHVRHALRRATSVEVPRGQRERELRVVGSGPAS